MIDSGVPSSAIILRARRWMMVGLVVSIIGTRIIEGGSSGTVAAGILPVAWIAVLATMGQAMSFAAPLLARVFARHNPASEPLSS